MQESWILLSKTDICVVCNFFSLLAAFTRYFTSYSCLCGKILNISQFIRLQRPRQLLNGPLRKSYTASHGFSIKVFFLPKYISYSGNHLPECMAKAWGRNSANPCTPTVGWRDFLEKKNGHSAGGAKLLSDPNSRMSPLKVAF